jgi:glutaredoxin 3
MEPGRVCRAGAPDREDESMPQEKHAILYRMVLPDHVCPFGVRARQMLEDAGYTVDDRVLATREEVDALKARLDVETTPQIFIDDAPIGGCAELEDYLAGERPA